MKNGKSTRWHLRGYTNKAELKKFKIATFWEIVTGNGFKAQEVR